MDEATRELDVPLHLGTRQTRSRSAVHAGDRGSISGRVAERRLDLLARTALRAQPDRRNPIGLDGDPRNRSRRIPQHAATGVSFGLDSQLAKVEGERASECGGTRQARRLTPGVGNDLRLRSRGIRLLRGCARPDRFAGCGVPRRGAIDEAQTRGHGHPPRPGRPPREDLQDQIDTWDRGTERRGHSGGRTVAIQARAQQ